MSPSDGRGQKSCGPMTTPCSGRPSVRSARLPVAVRDDVDQGSKKGEAGNDHVKVDRILKVHWKFMNTHVQHLTP